jgi:hypothetical protein
MPGKKMAYLLIAEVHLCTVEIKRWLSWQVWANRFPILIEIGSGGDVFRRDTDGKFGRI